MVALCLDHWLQLASYTERLWGHLRSHKVLVILLLLRRKPIVLFSLFVHFLLDLKNLGELELLPWPYVHFIFS